MLQESYEAHQLACRVGELDNWLDRVEHDLGTENHGVDVQSVEKLIEKHNLLKSEIEAKAAIIHETVEKANHLKKLVAFLAFIYARLKLLYLFSNTKTLMIN